MPDLLYPSILRAVKAGRVEFSTGSFRVMLTRGYAPAKAHAVRADVEGELEADGYLPGGLPLDTTGSTRFTLASRDAAWPLLSETPDHAIVYADMGGPVADVLVCCCAVTGQPPERMRGLHLTWDGLLVDLDAEA